MGICGPEFLLAGPLAQEESGAARILEELVQVPTRVRGFLIEAPPARVGPSHRLGAAEGWLGRRTTGLE